MVSALAVNISVAPEVGWVESAPEPSLLDRYLGSIRDRIRIEGLTSLYWASGIQFEPIASALVLALAEQVKEAELSGLEDNRCILIRPHERALADLFGQRFGCAIRTIDEACEDSFLIVNDTAVLDTTPVPDGGRPEFIEDRIVSELYLNLFRELKERSAVTVELGLGVQVPMALGPQAQLSY